MGAVRNSEGNHKRTPLTIIKVLYGRRGSPSSRRTPTLVDVQTIENQTITTIANAGGSQSYILTVHRPIMQSHHAMLAKMNLIGVM